MSFQINDDLDRVSREIESTSYDVDIAQEHHLLKVAEYDNRFAKECLERKALHPDDTQTDIKMHAEATTHVLRLEVVMAKSTYMKAQNKLRALRDRLKALENISNNLRAEAKIGRGTGG